MISGTPNFLCTTDRLKPFLWIETIEPYLSDLQPLSNIEEMEAEALRMDNCLKKLVGQAAAGYRLYFRLRSGSALTAELKKTAGGWHPGEIRGPRNQAVGEDLAAGVAQQLDLRANHLPVTEPNAQGERIARFIDGLRSFAGTTFPSEDIDRLADALLTIRGHTRAWTDSAYIIFSIKTGGFVQFTSSADGTEYLCGITSHKYGPERGKYLTSAAVDVIEGSGLLWPRGEQNFLRWFPRHWRQQLPCPCRAVVGTVGEGVRLQRRTAPRRGYSAAWTKQSSPYRNWLTINPRYRIRYSTLMLRNDGYAIAGRSAQMKMSPLCRFGMTLSECSSGGASGDGSDHERQETGATARSGLSGLFRG